MGKIGSVGYVKVAYEKFHFTVIQKKIKQNKIDYKKHGVLHISISDI